MSVTKSPLLAKRIATLRSLMKADKVDCLVVPRNDEYLGEYVPAAAERLLWLTGFSGSAGTALVGIKRAALIVDGRYTVQAAQETKGLSIDLLPPDTPKLEEFLAGFKRGMTLAFDAWNTSMAEARRLQKLADKTGLRLKALNVNLVDVAWTDRPAVPSDAIYLHPLIYSGLSTEKKLALLADTLTAKCCDCALLTDPHSVAWALNIRGSDVSHTPIALLRALVFKDGIARLFIDKRRCPDVVLKAFGKHVRVEHPDRLEFVFSHLKKKRQTVLVDPTLCPEAIRTVLHRLNVNIIEDQDPCILPRARKNRVEQNGARHAHIRDGAALSNYLAWLESAAFSGSLTEIAAQNKLESFRRATGKLKDLSFGSISASGPNAALPHYHAVGKMGRTLRRNEIYLIDSGGQYLEGTTDLTRTVIIGEASAIMKRHNTLVLKGMIAVSMAKFPAGTSGVQLDAMARAALWQNGYDFDHGTGHGVGSFLSVHEGPARISKAGTVALEPGMILSNEPGYYLKGKYGIRIENLLLVKPASTPKDGDRKMLSFETLTFAPIDKRLIDDTLLTKAEIHWLDEYHAEVFSKIGSFVNDDTRSWLVEACAPLTRRS